MQYGKVVHLWNIGGLLGARLAAPVPGARAVLGLLCPKSWGPPEVTGRFLSFDIGKVTMQQPQSWNRYAYALDNPLRYIDPDDRDSEEPSLYEQLRKAFLDTLNRFFPPAPVKTDPTAQALAEDGEISQAQADRMNSLHRNQSDSAWHQRLHISFRGWSYFLGA